MIRKEKHKKQDIDQGEEQQRNNPFIRNDGMRKPRNEGTDRKDIPAQDGKDLTEKNSQTWDQQVYKKTDIGTAEADRNGPKCKDIRNDRKHGNISEMCSTERDRKGHHTYGGRNNTCRVAEDKQMLLVFNCRKQRFVDAA